ncbi:hypothetical protein [Paenibacillus silvisoli]|uniref:hypothetical protein n=1 Tax=Paenibacillus silvisoli TaxID=3110539 RepID=UPI002803A4AC|nr:hypothetical protein [Paenibacillus silvisoli]
MESFVSYSKRLLNRMPRSKAETSSLPESSYSLGSSWVLDHITVEAPPGRPQAASNRFLPESFVSYLILFAAASTAAVTYGSAPVMAILLCSAIGLGAEAAFLSWRYGKVPAVREKRAMTESMKQLELEIAELGSELNELNAIKLSYMQVEEDTINDYVHRLGEAENRERQETEAVEKELRLRLGGLHGERQIIDKEEKTELSSILAAFQKAWLEEQLTKHRISQDKIPDIDDEMKRRLRAGGIRTPADFLDITINQSYGRKQIEKVYLILKNGGSVHVGMSRSQAKALIDWKRKIERRYRTKLPAALPRSEVSAVALRFKGRKTKVNDEEQMVKSEAQAKAAAIKQSYRPELEILTKEAEAARNRLDHELLGLDSKIDERNHQHTAKLREYQHLIKQKEAYGDDHFVTFLKRVFLFRA